MAADRVQRRLAAILAADVVGYSRLIEADEEGTRARIQILHSELINPCIASDGGRIVKTMGDGMLVEFPSAVDAVRDALAIQSAMADHNEALPEDQRFSGRRRSVVAVSRDGSQFVYLATSSSTCARWMKSR